MIFLLKLVVFETVETKVKQKKERKKITTQLKCKKKKMIEKYLHFYFIKMIFAFLNRRETCLYINYYIIHYTLIKSHSYCLLTLPIK